MLLVVPYFHLQIPLIHNQVNGAKTLVLDSSIAGPLGLVTEVSLLKVRSSSWELDLHSLVNSALRSRQNVLVGVRPTECDYDEHCLPLASVHQTCEDRSWYVFMLFLRPPLFYLL